MRNYIILNGQNSNEITGLLIQSLPPISQPKIRTNIEEIDGRDGDIITKLGYSAYNKEISIGLYGNYDVDDIIKYFTDNQSGKVTFSDEPDKYYNYEILEQIDFDKLIRYRTATVKLHCQPFKYSTTEEKIQINATEVSGSGSNITLENTEDGALFTSLQINGDTSQDGTPTPSSPVPINVVSGDNTINIVGKNLFDKTTAILNRGVSVNTGQLYKDNTQFATNFIKIKPNTTYVVNSFSSSSNRIYGAVYDSSNTYLEGISTSAGVNSFSTSNSNAKYIRLTGLQVNIDTYQLEDNSTSTEYEPYQSQTYSVNLGSIELCKIGDYQDYIYKENGNWYLYKAIGKVVLDGSESGWTLATNSSNINRYIINIPTILGNSSLLCNYFIGRAGTGQLFVNGCLNNPSSGNINFCNTDILTLEDWKTWLSTHNTIVYYVLSTPTTTQITDETLLSQLEALAGATTYLDQTNIITSGSTLNPLLDVTTYAVDDPNFNITNNGNIYSKPIITIYGVGTIGLYLNGIQVLSLDMGETTSQITIDVAKLEAYNQETGALMNRSVTGDYNNLSLNVGENTITESGTLQGIEIENYSRWL